MRNPTARYITLAVLRENLPVSNLALELSKNQSQLKAEASTDNAPATKNITTMNISAQPQVILHREIS